LRHSHSHLLPSTNKGPHTCHTYQRRQNPTTTHCNAAVPLQQHQQVATQVHIPVTNTIDKTQQQQHKAVLIHKHQQVAKRVIESNLHSTLTHYNRNRIYSLHCSTHTAIRVHIPVTHTNVDKHNNTLQRSRIIPTTTTSRNANASTSADYTAPIHKYNLNRNNIFQLRKLHSSFLPPNIKGST
jgi:hypothetical protein